MTFKTQLAADVSSVFLNDEEFAETVTYKVDGSGTGTSINAVITQEQALVEAQPGQYAIGTATISKADVSAPARYDTITTAAGIVWRVEDIIQGDGYMWVLQISTDIRAIAGAGTA